MLQHSCQQAPQWYPGATRQQQPSVHSSGISTQDVVSVSPPSMVAGILKLCPHHMQDASERVGRALVVQGLPRCKPGYARPAAAQL